MVGGERFEGVSDPGLMFCTQRGWGLFFNLSCHIKSAKKKMSTLEDTYLTYYTFKFCNTFLQPDLFIGNVISGDMHQHHMHF